MLKTAFLNATCLFGCLFAMLLMQGQETTKSFSVKYINEDLRIDGLLDEPIWEQADAASDFHQYFPSDSVQAQQQTVIKMLYSATTLYVGIKVYTAGDDYVIPSLQRDFRAGGNDNISLVFDTFNDGTNAFLFGSNPYGVRREALISGGGSGIGGFTTSWDVKWKGESQRYDGYYITEWAIPLSSFKFNQGETKWRFNSYRFDVQSNETSTWIKIPQNQLIFNLAFMGDMIFEKPLGKSRTPIALIPFTTGFTTNDFENSTSDTSFGVGGDAKIPIGNSLNLDLTLNPDFSTVEVDNFITNLTRFEVRLPERRQFFVDNNDLFGNFGGGRDANPFFSRRIGIASDTLDNTIENSIIGGARLSGKISNNLRLGFLSIQTAEDEANGIPSNNNLMLALQQKIGARSNIGAFFINRQALGNTDFLPEEDRYNRVVGLDYNLASKDNSWVGKAYAHKSFDPGDSEGNFSLGLNLGRNTRHISTFVDAVFIDEEFNSDLGFIPRNDILKIGTFVEGRIWPKKGKVNQHNFMFFPLFTWRPGLDLQNTDREFNLSWNAELKSQARYGVNASNRFIFLTDSFDPTGSDGIPLPADQGYTFSDVGLFYRSDRRKALSFQLEPSVGQFFNGERYSVEGQVSLRLQPKVFLSVDVNYDSINLPDPFPSEDIILISPRINITFSKSIFWSNLIQYSNQRDNLGFNSRLQWRFAPLSDLFIVYNDNYFVNRFAPRVRSLNLKLTYWLNI